MTLTILVIIFTATLIQSTFGFGSALIIVPFLTVLMGIKSAIPVAALVATTIHIYILITKWHKVHFPLIWRLVIASLLGIPLGVYVLRVGNEIVLKIILGLLIIIFSLYFLLKPTLPLLINKKYAYLYGFFAGILGGAYNINGPPIVIYGSMCRWKPQVFRATLQGYFFPIGLLLLFSHYSVGLWTELVRHTYFINLPFVLVAVWAGGKLNAKIRAERFQKYIYLFLVLTGIGITVQALIQLEPGYQ